MAMKNSNFFDVKYFALRYMKRNARTKCVKFRYVQIISILIKIVKDHRDAEAQR